MCILAFTAETNDYRRSAQLNSDPKQNHLWSDVCLPLSARNEQNKPPTRIESDE